MGEITDVLTNGLHIFLGRIDGLCGHAKSHEHSRDRRVYAGVEEEEPYERSYCYIEYLALYADLAADEEHCQTAGGPDEQHIVDMRAVEDGNDEYAADIVDHGEGCEENLHTDRHAFAEHGEHAEREGDIRGHRYGGSAGVGRAARH